MALKAINPIILQVEDYVALMGIPDSRINDIPTLNRIELFIEQATNQIDSLVSGNNDVGYLYRWWENLKDNPTDNQKGLKLQKSIASWVETFLQNGKFFTDSIPIINANFNIDIQSQSSNSDLEMKRKDIVQDLVAIGLYKTSNLSLNNNEGELSQQQIDDLIVVSQKYLNDNFIRRTPQFPLTGPLDMSSCKIEKSGGVVGEYQNANRPLLQSFKLVDCDLGVVDKSLNSDKVLDPLDNIYKLINEFNVNYFGGLTREEIYFAIQASGMIWNPEFNYRKGFVVQFTTPDNFLKFAESKIDNNIGNDPNTSPNEWNVLESQPIDETAIVEQLKPYINNEITKQINELPTVEVIDKEVFETELAKKANLDVPIGVTQYITGTNKIEKIITDSFSYTGTYSFTMGGEVIQDLGDPTQPQEAANKRYVDSKVVQQKFIIIEVPLTNGVFQYFPEGYGVFDIIHIINPLFNGVYGLYESWNYTKWYNASWTAYDFTPYVGKGFVMKYLVIEKTQAQKDETIKFFELQKAKGEENE